jgi:sulfonate transport system substrate-binding protein
MTRARPTLALLLLLLLALVATACGDDDETAVADVEADPAAATDTTVADTAPPTDGTAAATDTTAAVEQSSPDTVVDPEVPAGTQLRLGDQGQYLELPLTLSGELDASPTEYVFSNFQGGPPLLEAFNAGELDVGFVGDVPPIFAQAAGQDVAIVATAVTNGTGLALVVPPGSDIETVADLAGQSVAYTTGTALQGFALAAFEEAGLEPGDVQQVELTIPDIIGAVRSGDVAAGVLVDPVLSQYLLEEPDARILRDGTGLTTGHQYIIASRDAIADPAKGPAIQDLLRRLIRGAQYRREHQDEWDQAYYVDGLGQSEELAAAVSDRIGDFVYQSIDDETIATQQRLADLLFAGGALPDELDVSELFDTTFNAAVADELALEG